MHLKQNHGSVQALTLKDLFPEISWKMMYKKYHPVPRMVREFIPTTLKSLYLLKNGHMATYQGPHASEMMHLSSKSVAVMLSSIFLQEGWLQVNGIIQVIFLLLIKMN